ncbi:histidine kinase dimerization/phospho-acceptor domain-containing protein [Bradyrhizobium sp. RDI18]|uniref:histidine kinase dimerization/phospho-acceptor domain-containing protein n=1 Tax=Bradyrhizobium sp. RDI18 TaxID=3367400 RepID=UPI003712B8BA
MRSSIVAGGYDHGPALSEASAVFGRGSGTPADVELARINRYSMAGELCTSIAHELNQPLGAILLNAETMEQMLRSSPLSDATELLGIVSEIRRDDERAGKVLQHIRSLVRRVPIDVRPLDLNEVVSETLDFLSSLAIARRVQIRHSLAELPLPVKGDYATSAGASKSRCERVRCHRPQGGKRAGHYCPNEALGQLG